MDLTWSRLQGSHDQVVRPRSVPKLHVRRAIACSPTPGVRPHVEQTSVTASSDVSVSAFISDSPSAPLDSSIRRCGVNRGRSANRVARTGSVVTPGKTKPRVTYASPAARSLHSVGSVGARSGGASLVVMASAGSDLLGDQSSAAADATAVLALSTLVDPFASQHFELVHDDLLVCEFG